MQTPYGEIPDRLAKGMRPQEMHDFLQKSCRRRGVLRAGVLGMAAAASPVLWRQSAVRAATVPAVPPRPRWLALGPDPTTSMYVSWSAGTAELAATGLPVPRIRLGLDAQYGSEFQAGSCAQVPAPARHYPADNTFYSAALLTGLRPGTTYHYSVTNQGRTWTPDATFTTAPAGRADFRFTAFGDQAAGPETALPMMQLISRLGPALHLVTGDLAYATPKGLAIPDVAGYDPAQWDKYLRVIGDNGAASIPWQASVGAHEVEPLDDDGYAGFVTRFSQPYDLSSGSPVVFTFRYGNVAFVHLDGNDLSAQETINNGYTAGAQTAWLARTLGGYRAAGSGVDFIVVVCNCCCYSSNTQHGSDGGLREAWGPLFDRYQVDLVISGHVHAYERTNPIRAGQPTRKVAPGGTVNPAQDGTTYVCVGGGGNGLFRDWYGATGSGDRGSSIQPKVWRWSGGQTSGGGHGRPEDVTDTAKGYSAVRRAVYCCVLVDVTAPAAAGGQTSMSIRALMPGQSRASVSSIARPLSFDSVTLTRTSQA